MHAASAYASAAEVAGRSSMTSGAMNPGVPTMRCPDCAGEELGETPGPRRASPSQGARCSARNSAVPSDASASGPVRPEVAPATPARRAMPKSSTLSAPSLVRNTFSGLMSR
jgi:hypothetical protein